MSAGKHFSIDSFASQPIIQQELKRCRLRSVPFCTSAIFFALSLVYIWLFSFYGLDSYYSASIEQRYDLTCKGRTSCLVDFVIDKPMKGRIGLYYKLTKFSQMRRELATNFQSEMLKGLNVSKSALSSCIPRVYYNDTEHSDNLYIPCGLLPSTVFTDSFTLVGIPDSFSEAPADITLDVDRMFLYQPSNASYMNASHWLRDSGLFGSEGQTDPHFIVWMRQSAFTPFRKLYAVAKNITLKPQNYTMSIRNYYDVESFHGTKSFILAEIGSFGTIKSGPLIVFGVMALFFLVAAGILGLLGWKRLQPSSKFHPTRLTEIFLNPDRT
jgi:hypothetical protein